MFWLFVDQHPKTVTTALHMRAPLLTTRLPPTNDPAPPLTSFSDDGGARAYPVLSAARRAALTRA